jgi:hypothetical protein
VRYPYMYVATAVRTLSNPHPNRGPAGRCVQQGSRRLLSLSMAELLFFICRFSVFLLFVVHIRSHKTRRLHIGVTAGPSHPQASRKPSKAALPITGPSDWSALRNKVRKQLCFNQPWLRKML